MGAVDRGRWILTMLRNGLHYAFPDDNGVWHGQDFLLPGCETIGTVVSKVPEGARLCTNRHCECYTSLAYRQKEYGW